MDLGTSAEDTYYRGLADALIVTGMGTGKQTCYNHLRQVKKRGASSQCFRREAGLQRIQSPTCYNAPMALLSVPG